MSYRTAVTFRFNFSDNGDDWDEEHSDMDFVPRVGDYVMLSTARSGGDRLVTRVAYQPPQPKAMTPTLLVFVDLAGAGIPLNEPETP